ncbi:ADP-ribosylation factor-like protein 9 [Salvelinus namaycush]|uniref:ADP-ribosylation factor-like protein 9 n=1 Tax=Salvelinus namaycush TaxID=8040 RepID=A0A8U0QU96_SALNM|nr:ADP-ribosylation factor-like protein 9 [Salvelinus namaycush]
MPGVREAAVVGFTLAVTGGVGYVIWTFVSSGLKAKKAKAKPKPEQEPEKIEKDTRNETARKVPERANQTPTVVVTEVKPTGKQVLVLGLEGAGKTSLLHCFATGSLEQDVTPTQGFNAVSINREDLQIEFLEIGGTENLQPYWKRYMCKAMVLVFVVDSSDTAQFPLAKKHLHELLETDLYLPLVVLANKQDNQGACSITTLHEALSLEEVGDQRKLFLIGTHVRKWDTEVNSAVQDARDLIIQMVQDGR